MIADVVRIFCSPEKVGKSLCEELKRQSYRIKRVEDAVVHAIPTAVIAHMVGHNINHQIL